MESMNHQKEFLRKFTTLLNRKEVEGDPKLEKKVQNIIYEIKHFTSAELHSNISDIANYMLMFKKFAQTIPTYRASGFENRTIIVASNIPKVLPATSYQSLGMLLSLANITFLDRPCNELKKNIVAYMIKRYMILHNGS